MPRHHSHRPARASCRAASGTFLWYLCTDGKLRSLFTEVTQFLRIYQRSALWSTGGSSFGNALKRSRRERVSSWGSSGLVYAATRDNSYRDSLQFCQWHYMCQSFEWRIDLDCCHLMRLSQNSQWSEAIQLVSDARSLQRLALGTRANQEADWPMATQLSKGCIGLAT